MLEGVVENDDLAAKPFNRLTGGGDAIGILQMRNAGQSLR